MSDYKFNVRVYGLLKQDGKILITDEMVNDTPITKFPGGGLEFGEGTLDCLKREFREELGIDIHIDGHYYTTDFFQPSAFGESQVISIYYAVSPTKYLSEINNLVPGEQSSWLAMEDIFEDTFTLPIDSIVGKMIHEDWMKDKGYSTHSI